MACAGLRNFQSVGDKSAVSFPRQCDRVRFVLLVLAFILTIAAAQQAPADQRVPVEVFQVMELPLTVTDAGLIKTKSGYLLKCLVTNNSEYRALGVRYSLAVVDSANVAKAVITTNDGLKLAPYQTKSLTFKAPVKLKIQPGDRLILMPEQIISIHFVWDVLKAKEALTAYIAGDYSVTPRVMRVLNQIDAPPRINLIY